MIILILFLALLLRLININQSFWLDEAITASNARDYSLMHLYTNYLPYDNSPPGYLFLINTLFSFFPNTDLIARLPSVIFGVGTIFITFILSKKLSGENFAKVVAILIATSPLHIYYSQEARMYSLTAFLATVIMWTLVNYLDQQRQKFLLLYILMSVFLIYTHYLGGLLLIVANVLVFSFKKINKAWFLSQIIILISFIPWIPTFLKQLKLGVEGRGVSENFDQVLGQIDLKDLPLIFEKFTLGRIPVDTNWTLFLIIPSLLVIFSLLILGLMKSQVKNQKIIGLWFLIPIALAALISLKIPVFNYYRLLFVLPAFYILIVFGIFSFKKQMKILILILILLINIISTGVYYLNPQIQREQWKQSINWLEKVLTPDDIVLFASGDPVAPYLWYRPNHPEAYGAFLGFYNSDLSQEKVNNLVKDKKRVFVFTYLQDITDPERKLQSWIDQNNFKRSNSQSFIGVGEIQVYEY
jgi:mannosyltransferase